MNYSLLNPRVYSVALYERPGRAGDCVSYCEKLFYLISGEITLTVGGKKMRMAPGNLLYLPRGTEYSVKSKYMRAVVASFELCDRGEGEYVAPVLPGEFDSAKNPMPEDLKALFGTVQLLADLESERDTFIRMSNIYSSANGSYLAELSAMIKLMLLKLAEHTDEDALPSSMVENLDGYIRENVHDEISNTELGAIFGYHPFYISKLLKDRRGITLHQYVISYRFKYAASLLRYTDKPIADIADAAGFTDAPYFAKTFKQRYGMTPKEYRNKFAGDFI